MPGLSRLKYYHGQLLTSSDLEDQQAYHRESLLTLVRRFPMGVISGLAVVPSPDNTAFLIEAGIAVDHFGNRISVADGDLKVELPLNDLEDNPYLGIRFQETLDLKGEPPCEGARKPNRVLEGAAIVWDPSANLIVELPDGRRESHVTLARVELKVDGNAKECEGYDVLTVETDGRAIRIDAGLIQTEQLADEAVTAGKLDDRAVTTEKLDDEAVTSGKLKDGAVTQAKLHPEVSTFPKGPAGGHLTGTYPNPAVGEKKLVWDNFTVAAREVGADPGTIDTRHVVGTFPDRLTLQAGAVGTTQLAADSVTTAKLANQAVLTAKLADGAVTTPKIGNKAVTNEKIDDYATAIPRGKAGGDLDGSYPNPGILTGAVVPSHLSIVQEIFQGALPAGNLSLELELGNFRPWDIVIGAPHAEGLDVAVERILIVPDPPSIQGILNLTYRYRITASTKKPAKEERSFSVLVIRPGTRDQVDTVS